MHCTTLLMQQFATRQSGSGGLSDKRRGTVVTRQEQFFIILGRGNPTSVGLKLVNCSRTLKTNRGKGPFDKGTCPF